MQNYLFCQKRQCEEPELLSPHGIMKDHLIFHAGVVLKKATQNIIYIRLNKITVSKHNLKCPGFNLKTLPNQKLGRFQSELTQTVDGKTK